MSRRLTAALIWGLLAPGLALAAPAAAVCATDAAPASSCCAAPGCAMHQPAAAASCCCAPAEAPESPPATPANGGSAHETLSPPAPSPQAAPVIASAPGFAPADDDRAGDDAAPAVFLLDCAFLI